LLQEIRIRKEKGVDGTNPQQLVVFQSISVGIINNKETCARIKKRDRKRGFVMKFEYQE